MSADKRHLALVFKKYKSSFWGAFLPSQPMIVITPPGPRTFHSSHHLYPDLSHEVYLDGRLVGMAPATCPQCLALTADGAHLAIAACADEPLPKGARYATTCDRWCMMVDGARHPDYDDLGTPAFSPDGSHIAYVALDRGTCFLVVDGQRRRGISPDADMTVTFSPDGTRVAYVAQSPGNHRVVLDDQEGPSFAQIGGLSLRFSPDGTRLAYVAGLDTATREVAVVVDGQVGPKCSIVLPAWSTPGTSGSNRNDFVSGIAFSADGRHVSYAAVIGGRSCVVRDSLPGPAYEQVLPPVFLGSDSLPTYAMRQGGRWHVVAGGQADSVGHDEIRYNPLLRPAGGHWAYAVRQGARWTTVVDGRRDPTVDDLWIMDMIFSEDGRRCGYPVRIGTKEAMVIDGRIGPEWDGVSGVCFSPDSRHVAYAARIGKKWFVLVDGMAGPAYDELPGLSPVGLDRKVGRFDADGTAIEYIAWKGKSFYRVRQPVVSPRPSI